MSREPCRHRLLHMLCARLLRKLLRATASTCNRSLSCTDNCMMMSNSNLHPRRTAYHILPARQPCTGESCLKHKRMLQGLGRPHVPGAYAIDRRAPNWGRSQG